MNPDNPFELPPPTLPDAVNRSIIDLHAGWKPQPSIDLSMLSATWGNEQLHRIRDFNCDQTGIRLKCWLSDPALALKVVQTPQTLAGVLRDGRKVVANDMQLSRFTLSQRGPLPVEAHLQGQHWVIHDSREVHALVSRIRGFKSLSGPGNLQIHRTQGEGTRASITQSISSLALRASDIQLYFVVPDSTATREPESYLLAHFSAPQDPTNLSIRAVQDALLVAQLTLSTRLDVGPFVLLGTDREIVGSCNPPYFAPSGRSNLASALYLVSDTLGAMWLERLYRCIMERLTPDIRRSVARWIEVYENSYFSAGNAMRSAITSLAPSLPPPSKDWPAANVWDDWIKGIPHQHPLPPAVTSPVVRNVIENRLRRAGAPTLMDSIRELLEPLLGIDATEANRLVELVESADPDKSPERELVFMARRSVFAAVFLHTVGYIGPFSSYLASSAKTPLIPSTKFLGDSEAIRRAVQENADHPIVAAGESTRSDLFELRRVEKPTLPETELTLPLVVWSQQISGQSGGLVVGHIAPLPSLETKAGRLFDFRIRLPAATTREDTIFTFRVAPDGAIEIIDADPPKVLRTSNDVEAFVRDAANSKAFETRIQNLMLLGDSSADSE